MARRTSQPKEPRSARSARLQAGVILDPEDEHLRERLTIGSHGYAHLQEGGRQILLHRFLLGAPKGLVVDHIDGNTLNNQKKNLWAVPQGHNLCNVEGPQANSHSGFLGVAFDRTRGARPWKAYISSQRKTRSLGYFDTPEEAHLARLKGELLHWGPQPRRHQLYVDAGLLPC